MPNLVKKYVSGKVPKPRKKSSKMKRRRPVKMISGNKKIYGG